MSYPTRIKAKTKDPRKPGRKPLGPKKDRVKETLSEAKGRNERLEGERDGGTSKDDNTVQ